MKIRGCWFHFCQAVYKYVKKFCLDQSYLTDAATYLMIKRLLVLPLLDARNIYHLFDMLKDVYKDQINDSDFDGVCKLFEYYEKQWIRGSCFRPEDWSCFKKTIRTNNQVESWNRHIMEQGGGKSHNIYLLMSVLGKDATTPMSRSLHTKKAQADKDKDILTAYVEYRSHNDPWKALGHLVKACIEYCKWVPADFNLRRLATENI